jgi:hypothetical protein
MMPGKKACLGNAEQNTNDTETCLAVHKSLGSRYDPPGEHDASDPYPRTKFIKSEIAGHFEEEISNKENPGRPAERCGAEREVFAHRGIGKSDVHAINIVNEITDNQKGDEAPRDLVHGSPFEPMCVRFDRRGC